MKLKAGTSKKIKTDKPLARWTKKERDKLLNSEMKVGTLLPILQK